MCGRAWQVEPGETTWPGAPDLRPWNPSESTGAVLVSSREMALLDVKPEAKRTSGRNQ